MYKFDSIEDYIEYIAGYRELNGKKHSSWNTVPSPISLARYDVGIIESFAQQIDASKPFTDKQAELAKKIVLKYRRQLASLNVEIPEPLPGYRLGIREIDRAKRIYIEDQTVIVKFPYTSEIINTMRTQAREGVGRVQFDSENKVWRLGLTENNINFVITVGKQFDFDIDPEISQLFDKILSVEKSDYSIELIRTDTGFDIVNCPDSLRKYIQEHLGGFGLENELTLVDQSAVLGYTVNETIIAELVNRYGEQLVKWLVSRETTVDKNGGLEQALEYARLLNRNPVYVYDPAYTSSERRGDVYYLNRSTPDFVEPKLLITVSNVMIGSRKQQWVNSAEKVFTLV